MEFDFEKVMKAGEINAKAREYGKSLIVPGAKLAEVNDKIVEFIESQGGQLAFPIVISCDSIAAHDSAKINEDLVFSNQVVKLDMGVHIDGWISDTAVTIDLSGKHQDLVDASRDALNNVIEIIKPGITLGEIGRMVEKTITDKGFKPIKNLSGHQIGHYIVHTGLSIPNFDTGDNTELVPGMQFAIEPFATSGIGIVEEKGESEIFSMIDYKPVRLAMVREVQDYLYKNVLLMPFSPRMLIKRFGESKVRIALKTLKDNGTLRSYPPLVEKANGFVSQAEHTFYIDENWKVHITTK